MLAASGAAKYSGNSVTTLIVSIVLSHGDEPVPPRFHGRPGRDPFEPQQPRAVIRASPRHDQRPRDHLPGRVHHEQPRLRGEDGAGALDQGKDLHLPVLPVRLAQPSDYAGRLPSTPAFLSSERTVSVGVAPLASHACTCSAFTWMTAGLARGL